MLVLWEFIGYYYEIIWLQICSYVWIIHFYTYNKPVFSHLKSIVDYYRLASWKGKKELFLPVLPFLIIIKTKQICKTLKIWALDFTMNYLVWIFEPFNNSTLLFISRLVSIKFHIDTWIFFISRLDPELHTMAVCWKWLSNALILRFPASQIIIVRSKNS